MLIHQLSRGENQHL